jgi:hypothetical protein
MTAKYSQYKFRVGNVWFSHKVFGKHPLLSKARRHDQRRCACTECISVLACRSEVGAPAEKQKEAVLEELTESPPELHHVGTVDTTDPVSGPPSSDDGVVKSEVPEAFAEELKSDNDIVPQAEEEKSAEQFETPTEQSATPAEQFATPAPPAEEAKPTETVETVAKETGADNGETAPPARDVPVEVTHEDASGATEKHSKLSTIGHNISEKLHKLVGKD